MNQRVALHTISVPEREGGGGIQGSLLTRGLAPCGGSLIRSVGHKQMHTAPHSACAVLVERVADVGPQDQCLRAGAKTICAQSSAHVTRDKHAERNTGCAKQNTDTMCRATVQPILKARVTSRIQRGGFLRSAGAGMRPNETRSSRQRQGSSISQMTFGLNCRPHISTGLFCSHPATWSVVVDSSGMPCAAGPATPKRIPKCKDVAQFEETEASDNDTDKPINS